MRIQGDKETFLETMQGILRVVSPRATLPVLGGVRITAEKKQVEFAATDLEMFARVMSDIGVEEEGSVVVPGRLMNDILRSLESGKVVISGSGVEVRVEAGRSEFSINTFPTADFPQVPEVTGGEVCRVGAEDLARALKQVIRAASTDEARPVLTGVLWEVESGALKLAATDSYRVAAKQLVVKQGPLSAKAIIPGRALAEFSRQLANTDDEAEIWLGETQAAFKAGNMQLVTRLIDGEFPNWERLVPQGYENKLVVDRESFLAAVARVSLVAQANTPIKIHLADEVQLTATESGVAEAAEVVEGAEYSGSPTVVAFNPRFLAEGLEAAEGEKATIEVIDPAKPAVIKGDGVDDFTYVVMPVRLPSS